MKVKIFRILLISILTPIGVFGQTENINTAKYHSAKEIFEKKYQKQEYQRLPKSKIKVENNTVFLDGIKSIRFDEESNQTTKLIICNGFLDPKVINGSLTLKISHIEELQMLNPNPQTKRYKFWIFYSNTGNVLTNSVNPHEYCFELQNENADEDTSNEYFINGAKLTFLKYVGIII